MKHDKSKSGSNERCEGIREDLSAMIDGEATEAEITNLEFHLQTCQECEDYFQSLSVLHIRLREECIEAADISAIWAGVTASLDEEDMSAASVSHKAESRRFVSWVWAPLAAAMILFAVFVGLPPNEQQDGNQLPVITETSRDYETFRTGGDSLDVATTDVDSMRRWMVPRVDFELPADISPPLGFKLAGGRLCLFLQRRLAFYLFKKGESALSLYVTKKDGLKVPNTSNLTVARTQEGLTSVIWLRAGLVYVVVSDLPESEVVSFVSGMSIQQNTPLVPKRQI